LNNQKVQYEEKANTIKQRLYTMRNELEEQKTIEELQTVLASEQWVKDNKKSSVKKG
jgi:hypothetical protein